MTTRKSFRSNIRKLHMPKKGLEELHALLVKTVKKANHFGIKNLVKSITVKTKC